MTKTKNYFFENTNNIMSFNKYNGDLNKEHTNKLIRNKNNNCIH